MKLYVVTQGKYSDRTIIGIVDDKSLIQMGDEDEIEVTEYELNDLVSIPPGYRNYSVEMNKDGTAYADPESLMSKLVWSEEWRTDESWHTHAIARSEEHAIKIVNEKRIELLANNEW